MTMLHLDTLLFLLHAAPAAVAFARMKDVSTRTLCGVVLAIDVLLGVGPLVGVTIRGPLGIAGAAATAVVGVVIAARLARHKQPVLATLLVTIGVLLAALALGVVDLHFATR